ncbi:hypothetical protein [Chroococcus sp. FPU101]|uniref:hypothetical protein n=1 Tax=Chroococcus sp. FPU101 TaxID=1974212 RepID=UPI001A8E8331|nr:hypothetical protein [Chroococcus sp. FPU101]GFE72008.1 hypothetical protein CFPU101_46180 [Chroococcus sp. FPU101]
MKDAAVIGAVGVVVNVVTMIAICYGADALATSVFPPAAAVAPFCPAIAEGTGALVGTGTAVGAVKALAK